MMFLYTAEAFEGEIKNCGEGVLNWVDGAEVMNLNLWQGDRIFLELLNKNAPFFSLKLNYKGDDLVSAELDGERYWV